MSQEKSSDVTSASLPDSDAPPAALLPVVLACEVPDADALERAAALGWLLGALHRDHPGWLTEQADKAGRFAATSPLADARTGGMAAVLRRWADDER